MSDYKNVAMVNNPLVYRLSLTDGQLIPGPLVAIARYAEPMDLGSGYRTEFKVLMGSPR